MDNVLKLSEYLQNIFITIILAIIIYLFINVGNRYLNQEKKLEFSRKKIIITSILILLTVIIYNLFKGNSPLKQIFSLVFYSMVLAYLLNPIVNFLESKGVKRTIGILIVFMFLILIIVTIILAFIPKLSKEFENLITILPNYFNRIYNFFNKIFIKYSKHIDELPPVFQGVRNVFLVGLRNFQESLLNYLIEITNSVVLMFSKFLKLIIVPILTFYFLKDKDYFKKKIIFTIPRKHRNTILQIGREIDIVLGKFIRGQLLVCSFVGISTTIALLIIGVDFALIIGFVAGIADLIPYFGPVIGIFPAVIFALLKSPIKVLWVIIAFVIIQQLECNVIEPKIVGSSIGIHPVLVIISLLIGGNYFGIIGMIFAIPITIVLKVTTNFLTDKISRL